MPPSAGDAETDLLVAVDRLTQVCLTAGRLEEALMSVVRETVGLSSATAGAIWVVESPGDRLRLGAKWQRVDPIDANWLLTGGGIAEKAVQDRRPIRSDGRMEETDAVFYGIPLIAYGEAVGAMIALGSAESMGGKERRFTDRDERFFDRIARQAAGVVLSGRLSAQVRESRIHLQEMKRRLARVERLASLGEMSAKVSHEIRNPLAAIGGFIRRIEKRLPQDDPGRAYTEIVKREMERLVRILDEHLEFAGSDEPRLQMTNLVGLLRETVALVRDEINRKGIRLIEHGAGGIPEMLLDADRIKQVLLNILKNAIESTRRGEQIRVQARGKDGWAQIEIANNGEQAAGEVLERLFIPFAAAREGGHGLGLAVADRIVKDHGGEIRVCSTEDWAMTFTVSLPIRSNEDRRRGKDRRRGGRRRRVA